MARKPPTVSGSGKYRDDDVHPRTTKRTPAKKKKKRKSIIGRLIKWCFILGIWCAIFAAGFLAWFAKDLPDIAKAANFDRQTSIIVKAADGSTIARFGEQKGENVSVKELPKHLVEAVLATEDRRFYEHAGIDPLGIARAMVVNITKGRMAQGGSTITQQLAKNLFLTNDRNMQRKIQEAMLAIWLEYQLSKDEILSAYLNRVYLGSGVYGVSAASKLYFGKDVREINLREAAILAGLLKAPSRYSPLNNPKLAKERSDVVLTAMVDAGYIKKKDITALEKLAPSEVRNLATGDSARYFADWVIEGLDDLIGTPEMDIIVETTMDKDIQAQAEKVLSEKIKTYGAEKNFKQGAVLVMRPDGSVLAMVGGHNYAQSQFNRTVQALRSAGSSFKPVVFLTALRQGMSPQDMVLDAPITEGKYRPENFSDKYMGNVTLQDALTHSLNTAAVRTMKNVGVDSVIETAKDLGIISKLEPDLSLALGSSGITMLEMNTAYATIANGGNSVYPYAITSIKTSDGRVLYERKTPHSHYNIINPRDAYNLKTMMQNVIDNGTGRRAKLPFPAAGKTGTSQESRDAWFVGFTERVVTSVWLGNDDNSPMKDMTGGSVPAEIWHDVMAFSNDRYEPFVISSPSDYGAQDTYGGHGASEGFDGLLGRLLGGGGNNSDNNATPKKPRPKNDYSNLNE